MTFIGRRLTIEFGKRRKVLASELWANNAVSSHEPVTLTEATEWTSYERIITRKVFRYLSVVAARRYQGPRSCDI